MVEIVSVVDDRLGPASHVVGLDDGTALVVDPTRFPERQRRLADIASVEAGGWAVGGLSAASGLVVAARRYETHPAPHPIGGW